MRTHILTTLKAIKAKSLTKSLNLVFFLLFTFFGQAVHANNDLEETITDAFFDTASSDGLLREMKQLPQTITDTFADTVASDDLIRKIKQLPSARKEATLELQKILRSDLTGDRYIEAITEGLSAGITQKLQERATKKGLELNPWVSQLFIEEIEEFMSEYFISVGLSDNIAYATWGLNFSTEELREITRFHKTTTGKKFNEFASDLTSNIEPTVAVQGYHIKRAGPIMAEAFLNLMSKYPNLFQ